MLEKPVNPNYCGTVVKIEKLVDLPNCDNVVAAIIFGNSVIVGKDTKIGDYGRGVPIETQLSEEFLSKNNLYRDKTLNTDQEKKGYFEQNGRIRAVKFRGHKSEGIFFPTKSFSYITDSDFQYLKEGVDFDKIGKHTICKKYIVRGTRTPGDKKTKADKKAVKKFDRLVENQFRLHIDTENFRRNAHKINPDDYISITNKLHGTSWVVGKVLVKEKLGWFKELLKKFFPRDIIDTKYDVIYSSRMVVKNKYINEEAKNNAGYYGVDVWGEIADKLKDTLLDGITLYGEAVGQLASGAWIQKGYDYGTRPNHYEIYVYRITYTNPEGKLIEFSWPQIKEYCNKFGIKHVPELYYGKAKDFWPQIPLEQHWNQNFLGALESEFMLDRKCPLCANDVWEEGIVIRVDGLFECPPYKLKNFAFLGKETEDLDKGVIDLESEQSLTEEDVT